MSRPPVPSAEAGRLLGVVCHVAVSYADLPPRWSGPTGQSNLEYVLEERP